MAVNFAKLPDLLKQKNLSCYENRRTGGCSA